MEQEEQLQEPNQNQVALLMDFENLVLGIESHDRDGRAELPFTDILRYLEERYGRVVRRMAIADWSSPKVRKYSKILTCQGVEMRHVTRVGYNNRCAVETGMVIYAMECLQANPQLDTFILGTGDANCFPLLSYLRSHGCSVVILGAEGTVSNLLASTADEAIAVTENDFRIITGDPSQILEMENEDDAAGNFPPRRNYAGGYGRQENFRSNLQLPLDEYLKASRKYIWDGPQREQVLTNIYTIMSAPKETVLDSDFLRVQACDGLDVDDRAWNGTICSLTCGNCLQELKDDLEYGYVPKEHRRLTLCPEITSLEDFLRSYYCSLFFKAMQDRNDLTLEAMLNLMHPEEDENSDEAVRHAALFAAVLDQLKNKQR